jgi:Ca2+-binding RTX toxin-like protein
MTQLKAKVSAADYTMFDQALASSATLTTRLNEQIGKSVTALDYRSGIDGAFFQPDSSGKGPIVIGDKFFVSLKANSGQAQNNLIFVLGHEASHGQNAAGVKLKDEQLLAGSTGPNGSVITAKSVSYNGTQFVSAYTQNRLQDEALSNIRGWNDVVSGEAARLGVTTLTAAQLQALYTNAGYASFFLKPDGTYKAGFSAGTLSLGMVDPAVAGNVAQATADQGLRAPSTVVGITYNQFYSAAAIDLAATALNGRPYVLDFAAAGLLKDNAGNSITLAQAFANLRLAGLDGNGAAKIVVQDSGSGTKYTVTKTKAGLVVTTTPVGGAETVVPNAALPVKVVAETGKPTIIEQWVGELGQVRSITGGQIGAILGSTLGRQIAGNDPFAQLATGTVLTALGQALGRAVDTSGNGVSLTKALSTELNNLPASVRDVGVGAVSSALVAEFGSAIGLSGDIGGVFSATAGAYVGQIAVNIARDGFSAAFSNLGSINPIAIVGAYFGTKLAMSIGNFETIGGQIGASIGSSIGSIIIPGPIGAFLGTLVGGLVGSLFGGTPRAGADVLWDSEGQQFDVGNAYARKGGSRDAAVAMATTVAQAYNSVLSAIGGKVLDPARVIAGNYGTRKSEYVYRPVSTTNADSITARFKGKTAAVDLTTYGVLAGLQGLAGQVAGGDVYLKRALLATASLALRAPNSGGPANGGTFDLPTLTGNMQVALDYSNFILNGSAIKGVIAAQPNSEFTAAWTATLARAIELGLNRRAQTDWTGGFAAWMDERTDGKIDGRQLSAGAINPIFDATSSERFWLANGLGVSAVFGDNVQAADKTTVQGTAANDSIIVSGAMLISPAGLTLDGVVQAGGAASSKIAVATVIDGGQGDDFISGGDLGNDLLGGIGNDTIVGGKLDDWLLGGDGNDRLFAGAASTTGFADTATASINAALAVDGGSGNYLDGGAGDDRIYGASGSDWLAGGDGVDLLYGGAGGDILNAGRGNEGSAAAPAVMGGAGSDQYVFNRGDGVDVYYDDGGGMVAMGGYSSDSIGAAMRARSAGTLAKNWAGGGEFTVDGSTKGGDDAIAFGLGITMLDILLERSGSVTAPGMDLIVKIQRTDGSWQSGDDQIIVKDWFEGTRRIEWLRFTNGEEIRIGDFTSFQRGTAGADTIVGTAGNDFQYGGDGNDRMFGLAGNDFGAGGRGNDLVAGNDDNDIVLGGNDDDVVLGGLGNDLVSGDDGNDRIYGGAGNDILTGGRGNDEIVTGAGNDIVRFERGDGRDTLSDDYAGSWELVWQNGSYVNGYTVDGAGVVSKGGVVYNNGTDWIGNFDYNEQGGNKTLYRLVPPTTGAQVANAGSDTLEFGTGIDIQDVLFRQDGADLRLAIGRSGASVDAFDTITDQIRIKEWFGGAARSIESFAFVNTGVQAMSAVAAIGGTDGADTLVHAATGAAWITGGAGDDTIAGNAGADILSGGSGADSVSGLAGNDVLYGGDGDDVLIGGVGADILIGGSGADTASYDGATAAVTVFLASSQGTSTGEAGGDSFVSVENITGSAYSDTLYGDDGANILDGGSGTDTLLGGAGDDIYLLNANGGIDTISDRLMSGVGTVAGAAGDDTLEVGAGLSLANLSFVRSGSNLEVQVDASNKAIVRDFYATTDAQVETIVFADGLSASLSAIRLPGEAGTSAADLMVGNASANALAGLGGNDVLSGGAGADTLAGGDGDDVLEGGAGGDVLDGGSDTVSLGGTATADSNGDTIRYVTSAAGISVNLLSRALAGGDADGDSIVADGAGVSTIENVTGSSYADVLIGDARANVLVGLAGADTLSGGGGADVLVGGEDADVLSGGDGDDNIDAGDGNDINVHGDAGKDLIAGGAGDDALWGDAGADTIDGGTGADTLWGGLDNDTLGGGDGDDRLYGEAGDDKLAGGAGNDALQGGDGNDTLSGDAGDDTLAGGAGDDTYAFDARAGNDTITDAAGANRIVFQGATQEQLWLTRSGNDLRIAAIGGTSFITVVGYFASTSPSTIREIATADASIFLKYAGSLITRMTAASATTPPSVAAIPAAVAAERDALWWKGGKAAPTIANQSFTTNEDTALSRAAGAVDHDENVAGYAIEKQATRGSVSLNATTGAWTYTPGLNYFGSDSFVLNVRDADGQVASATMSITVAPVNDAPVFGAAPTLAVNEGAATGTAIGTITASDVEASALTFSITDANSPFQINAATGALTVRDGTLLDYETATTRTVNVQVTDGTTPTVKGFVVTVRNVNEAPNTPSVSGTPLARASEPTAGAAALAGTTIATLTATDPDKTTPGFRLVSGSTAVFAIAGSALTFAATFAPDFEAIASGMTLVDRDGDGLREVEYTATIQSWDGALASSGSVSVTVGIEDTNEAPSNITYTSVGIDERDRPPAGAVRPAVSLGLLAVVDPDLAAAGESHVLSVADGRFEIVNGNELRLKADQSLDYETAAVETGTSKRYVDVAITARDRAGSGLALTQNKRVYINDKDDYLYGTTAAETLTGAAGRDLIYAYDGNDVVNAGTGNDTVWAGIGNDTVDSGAGDDIVYGEDGADRLSGGAGADELRGGGGNDWLYEAAGESDADRLYGEDGDDTLRGGGGGDLLDGGAGIDTIYGGAGNDTITGGLGDDVLSPGDGADTVNGGDGVDTLSFYYADEGVAATSGVVVDLSTPARNSGAAAGDSYTSVENVRGTALADDITGDAGANVLRGDAGADSVSGGDGNDEIHGDDGNDILRGGAGADQVNGGTGDDTLYGDAGDDVLTGGQGNDLLYGGAGNDRFIFNRNDGNDTIDQTGSVTTDRDIVGFSVGRENLWFSTVGSDIKIGVLGTSALDGSVTLKAFSTASQDGRAQIAVVIAQTNATVDLQLGEFAAKLDRFAAAIGYTPTTQAQMDGLMSNASLKVDGLTFRQTWTNYWTQNKSPNLAVSNGAGLAAMAEDQYRDTPYVVNFTLGDDYDAPLQLAERTVVAVATSGSTTPVYGLLNLSVTWPASNNGAGTISVKSQPNASGTGYVWIHTRDSGGLATDQWIAANVAAVADAPALSVANASGNAGGAIALSLTTQLADTDGSEVIDRIEIAGVPAGYSFNTGTNLNNGTWRFTPAQLAGLSLNVPAGQSADLVGATALRVTSFARETINNAQAASTTQALAVRVNAPPTSISLSRTGINENAAVGTIIGSLRVVDPDVVENNMIDPNQLNVKAGESRWISVTGPQGGTVTALQTGQFDGGEDGGGTYGSSEIIVNPDKAYRYSVYFYADANYGNSVYFGISPAWAASAVVENGNSGGDDVNPYFVARGSGEFATGHWYRFEGYVLPRGYELVDNSVFGGIYDVTAGGGKVMDTQLYRWNDQMATGSAGLRFFNYYGGANGYQSTWYQPVIEELSTFVQTSGGGVSIDGRTGLVKVAGGAPDYEAATSLPLGVTAIDSGGLGLNAGLSVAINPVNERPYNAVYAGSAGIVYGNGAYFTETGLGDRPANNGVTVASFNMGDPDNIAGNPDNRPLSLVITDNFGGWFSVDGNRVVFKPGLNFDYEGFKNSGSYGVGDYNNDGRSEVHAAYVGVAVTDGLQQSDTIYVNVFVEDVAEAPNPLSLASVTNLYSETLGEESHGNRTVAVFNTPTDPDGPQPTLDFASNPNGWFKIVGNEVRVNDGVNWTADWLRANAGWGGSQGGFYNDVNGNGRGENLVATVQVIARDSTGQTSAPVAIPVYIEDVNERPRNLVVEASNVFGETGLGNGSHANQLLARFTMADPDGPAPGVVILGGNQNGWFQSIYGNHIGITNADFTAGWLRANLGQYGMDSGYYYDTNGNGIMEIRVATLTLAAQDAGGLQSDPYTYNVFIEDTNEAPYILGSYPVVAENSPGAGQTAFYQMQSADPDSSAAYTNRSFSLINQEVAGMFSIRPDGTLVLQGAVDYETKSSYWVDLRIQDQAGAYSDSRVGIYVSDVAENAAPKPFVQSLGATPTGQTFYIFPGDTDDASGFTLYGTATGDTADRNITGTWDASRGAFLVRIADSDGDVYTANRGVVTASIRDPFGNVGTVNFSWNSTRKPGVIPPIVLDLDGDGIELVSVESSTVRFDMDLDGLRDRTGWAGADDGLLVLDRNQNGTIDNAREISFVGDKPGAISDLEGLSAFDTSGNGQLDARDVLYTQFQVWRDANQDGVSQAGELFSLEKLGIASITLAGERQAIDPASAGNVVFAMSEFTRPNGSTGDVGDVFLAYEAARSERHEFGAQSPSLDKIAALPALLSSQAEPSRDEPLAEESAGNVPAPVAGEMVRIAPASEGSLPETALPSASLRRASAFRQPALLADEEAEIGSGRHKPHRRLAQGGVPANPVGQSNASLEQLIAAMASFQSGERNFGAALGNRSQVEAAMEQLAPAV